MAFSRREFYKEQLKDYILKARLVILPSTCYENCPLAVIEAQRLGAALLVPAYGGATEMRNDSLKRTSEYKTLQEYTKEIEQIYCEVIKR